MARYYDEKKNVRVDHQGQKYNDKDRQQKDNDGMGFDPRMAMRANMNEYYAGMPARKRQEIEDKNMIHEDATQIANLPQYVKIEAYPKSPRSYLPEGIDDSIRGVDMQIDYDGEQRDTHFYPKKV